jgi:hypothetical protein
MAHCHSLACGSVSYSMTYMFCWRRLGMKRRQRPVDLALVHFGRIPSVLDRLDFRISRTLEQVRLRLTYLRRGYSRFFIWNTRRAIRRSAQSASMAERHLRIDVWTSQPKSCLFDRTDWLQSGFAENNIFHRHCTYGLLVHVVFYCINVSTESNGENLPSASDTRPTRFCVVK